jgi:hypothetical protein
MRFKLVALVLWIVAMKAPPAHAAECLPRDLEEAKSRADYIFEATLRWSAGLTTGEMSAEIQVHRVWRGSVFEQSRLHYAPGNEVAVLSPRMRYLIFARRQTSEDRVAGKIPAHAPDRFLWLPRCAVVASEDTLAREVAERLGQSSPPLRASTASETTGFTLTLRRYPYRGGATRLTVIPREGSGLIEWVLGPAAESMAVDSVLMSTAGRARDLTPEESKNVRDMIALAGLFDGGHIGADMRVADLFLEVLHVTDFRHRTVMLVTTGNPTFGSGPRKVLLDWLREQADILRKARR